jgi:hypothetical protein
MRAAATLFRRHLMPTKSHTLSDDDRKHIDTSNFAFPDQRKGL